MAHYRTFFENKYIGAWDLVGRDWTLRIRHVAGEILTVAGGAKSKKPVIYFHGADKGLALNKTNAKLIAAMYGNDTAQWVDRCITLFPTTTEMSGQIVDAVRVRPRVPSEEPSRELASQPVDPDMRERQNRAAEAAERGNHGT